MQLALEEGGPDRLGELGLDVEILHRAIRAGLDARGRRTAFAPRNAQGADLVSYTVEELRYQLEAARWTADFAGGQERTVSPDGLTAVIVSTGAGAVGDLTGEARTAHPKGPLMRDAVSLNQGFVQDELPFDEPRPSRARPLCWVLLIRVDPDQVRAELSAPTGMRDGLVVSWAERIPLPPLALGAGDDPAEEPGEVDVPVAPR
jgi:hypothetical protein